MTEKKLVHKRRSDLTYCHQNVADVESKGFKVKTRWPGVTCRKCSSFRRLKKPRDAAERDYWKIANEKRIKREQTEKIKEALSGAIVHGLRQNKKGYTFCNEVVLPETLIMKFPRITCEACLAFRKELINSREIEEGEYDY